VEKRKEKEKENDKAMSQLRKQGENLKKKQKDLARCYR
jgi:hypothetical protein